MHSEIESSVALKPPNMPPPPPPPPMLNINAINDGRSQLLADIRKGATLKKAAVTNDSTVLSPSDKLKKQTQDLLQAELTNTLKRRKPVMITESPKYEYPTYDNDNNIADGSSNGSSINGVSHNNNNNNSNNNNFNTSKINDSSNSTSANINNSSPLNVSAVLSVVTGIKLPDIQYDANASAKKSQSADKPKISHGKPNFTIHQKENKPISITTLQTSPKIQMKAPETVQRKWQRPSFFTSNSIDKTTSQPLDVKPIPNGNSESQVEKVKSIFTLKSQKSVEPDMPRSPKIQPKLEMFPKKMNSVDDCINNVPSGCVANYKALFEKPTQDEAPKTPLRNIQTEKLYLNKTITAPPTTPSNGKFTNGFQRNQNPTEHSPGVTRVTLNKNVSYLHGGKPKFEQINKDNVDHFERSIHTINEISTTNGIEKYETKQIEQKTFVSFSKDLLNAPNNYPDQIRVKKTIITQRSHAIPDNPFNNIRFSIKTDGQVIPKAK